METPLPQSWDSWDLTNLNSNILYIIKKTYPHFITQYQEEWIEDHLMFISTAAFQGKQIPDWEFFVPPPSPNSKALHRFVGPYCEEMMEIFQRERSRANDWGEQSQFTIATVEKAAKISKSRQVSHVSGLRVTGNIASNCGQSFVLPTTDLVLPMPTPKKDLAITGNSLAKTKLGPFSCVGLP